MRNLSAIRQIVLVSPAAALAGVASEQDAGIDEPTPQ
jgi:hypothetical protein